MLRILAIFLFFALHAPVFAQSTPVKPLELSEVNTSGPRLGLTYVPGNSIMKEYYLKPNSISDAYSKFGWLLEMNIHPGQESIAFLTQMQLLIGGVEYGKLLPDITILMGLRFIDGWDALVGPAIFILTDEVGNLVMPKALCLSVGKVFAYKTVAVPVSFMVTRGGEGVTLSVVVGYSVLRNHAMPSAFF